MKTAEETGTPLIFPSQPLFLSFVSKTICPPLSNIFRLNDVTASVPNALNRSFLPSLLGVNAVGTYTLHKPFETVIASVVVPQLLVADKEYDPGCVNV